MSASLSGDTTMGVGVDGMRIAIGVGDGCMGATVGGGVGGMGVAVGEDVGAAVGAGVGCMGVTVGVGASVAIGLISARGISGSIPQAASANDAATATATATKVCFTPKIPIRMIPFRLSHRIVTHLIPP